MAPFWCHHPPHPHFQYFRATGPVRQRGALRLPTETASAIDHRARWGRDSNHAEPCEGNYQAVFWHFGRQRSTTEPPFRTAIRWHGTVKYVTGMPNHSVSETAVAAQ